MENFAEQVNRMRFVRAFKWIYKDVLENGMKIRVFDISRDGTCILETYRENGWWIFKRKNCIDRYKLTPGNLPMHLKIVHK